MAFPFTGRSQLLGVPMAWRRRQAMAKWRWGGEESGAGPPFRGPFQVRGTFFDPGAATRPWDIRGRPLDIRERP